MALKLMYITNQPEIAKIAEKSGVDWIFIDLETIGKANRQGHLDTVMSKHSIADIETVSQSISKAKLLVRTNPLHENSADEIKQIIDNGADILMLPYFKTADEANAFIDMVDGRAQICLLCETPEAVDNIDAVLELQGIDYIHIGLNDLHLGYGMKFMFELLADGTVEKLCNKFADRNIEYGFGGIARLGLGALPAENVIAEHYRLGSQMVILSRSFCNTDLITDLEEVNTIFKSGMKEIRSLEMDLEKQNADFFENNQLSVEEAVGTIKKKLESKS